MRTVYIETQEEGQESACTGKSGLREFCFLICIIALHLNVCSGNLWFDYWVFVGMILSLLKLGKGHKIVHSAHLEILKEPVCEKDIEIVFLCSA